MNFKSWINQYFTLYKAFDLKPTTVNSYLRNLSNIPDNWEYETVSLADVQSLINSLAARGLATSTIKHVFQIIKEPLENGSLYGLPDRKGLLYAIRLPKQRKKLVHALSDEELMQLRPFIELSDYSDVYFALLQTGMRFSELAGLNNADFVPSSSEVKIQRSFYRGQLAEATKTDSGIRIIPLNLTTKTLFLRNWCRFTPKLPLFRNLSGQRLSYNTIVHNWHRVLDNAGLPRCGLHVLRHTYATQLLDRDVSLKVVSSLLGHKSISVTADIYCDVTLAAKRAAVLRLEDAAMQTAKPSVLRA